MYDRQSWPEHIRGLQWKQGEHLLISAPTGAGKTTLVPKLCAKRSHVVVFVSKIKDDTIRREFKGYHRISEWPPPQWANKVLLWPKPGKTLIETLAIQQRVFRDALNAIAQQGNWCVVIDESHWTTSREFLGLGAEVAILHHQGRSSGISMVNLTQRPAWIPKIIYSSVTHAYIARTRDRDDLKRLADLGGIDPRKVAETVIALPTRHDYLYVSPQSDATPRVVNLRK